MITVCLRVESWVPWYVLKAFTTAWCCLNLYYYSCLPKSPCVRSLYPPHGEFPVEHENHELLLVLRCRAAPLALSRGSVFTAVRCLSMFVCACVQMACRGQKNSGEIILRSWTMTG